MPLVKNIVTDYGCPQNGTSDCMPYFIDWRDDAQAFSASFPNDTVELTIPAHANKYMLLSNTPGSYRDQGGMIMDDLVRNFTLNAYGAHMDAFSGGVGNVRFGNYVSCWTDDLGESISMADYRPFCDTVPAGSTTIHFKDSGKAALFAVGECHCIAGFDIYGYGQPAGHHFWQYFDVASVNTGANTITATEPFRYTFRDDWPRYTAAGFNDHTGGPAAVFRFEQGWNKTTVVNGLTLSALQSTNIKSRHHIFRDCTFPVSGPNMSNNQTILLERCAYPNNLEIDKRVDHIIADACTCGLWQFQTSTIGKVTLRNGTSFGVLDGCPKKLVIEPGCSVNELGVTALTGSSTDEIVAHSSYIGSIVDHAQEDRGDTNQLGVQNSAVHSMRDGVITYTHTTGYYPWAYAVPGYWALWVSSNGHLLGSFQILNVTFDRPSGITRIYTSWRGGFPDASDWGNLWIKALPCLKMKFTNCTGGGAQYSLPENYGRPYRSYYKTTFTESTIGDSNTGNPGYTGAFYGQIDRINVNVTDTYSGAQGTLLYAFASYSFLPLNKPNFDQLVWVPKIDLTLSGLRTINRNGTVTGGGGGDTAINFASVAPCWTVQGFSGAVLGNSPAAQGTLAVDVEVFADQQIRPAPSIAIHSTTYRNTVTG